MLTVVPTLLRRLVPPETSRAVRSNLAVVGAFVVVALFLLTRTLVAAADIDHDIESAVNPEMAEIGTDTLRLPVLDRTAPLVERIAEAARSLHHDLAATGASTGDIEATTRMLIADVASIGVSIDGIDASVAAVRAAAERLVPIVVAIRAETGDITADFAGTASLTDEVEAAVALIVVSLGETAAAVGRVDGRIRQVEGSLGTVRRHAGNIENSAVLRLTNLLPPTDAARPAADVG